jgi:hypothetical protein
MGGERMSDRPQLASVQLELLDQRLRGHPEWDATDVLETFRGKVNRMSIGLPRWHRDVEQAAMTLDLTLLPDIGCRFVNAELALRLEGRPAAGHAVVARLDPAELGDAETVVRETTGGLKVSLGETLSPVVGGEVGRSRVTRGEVARTLVRLAAFGAGTQEAGWRFTVTDARDIPLNTTGLKATISYPPRWSGIVWFSVVAQIQVRSRTDRWLTAAFGMGDSARLECSQEFPP